MADSKIFSYLEDIKGEPTAHLSGLKKVFLGNMDTHSQITQFAYGEFRPGEICPSHKHDTMYECFYFIEGNGQYIVGEEVVDLKPGTFLSIPPLTVHELKNNSQETLKFVYFGVATD